MYKDLRKDNILSVFNVKYELYKFRLMSIKFVMYICAINIRIYSTYLITYMRVQEVAVSYIDNIFF